MDQLSLKKLFLKERILEVIPVIADMHPADVAESLRDIPLEIQVKLFAELSPEWAAEIIQEVPSEFGAEILNDLAPNKAAEILQQMYTDDAVDLLSRLPKEDAEELIALMKEDGQEIKELLKYEDDTSGGLMATEFVAICEEQTIGEALALLRQQALSAETAYYIYVLKNDRTLVGVVSLRDLVVNPLDTRVEAIMKRDVIAVPEDMDQEEVARIFEKYGFLVLPVIDKEQKMVGIITVDDILVVNEEEATEDIHKGASIAPLETGYNHAGVWTLFSKRIFWLVALIFVNLISSSVIAAYEGILASVIALTFFIPLLIDTGGNTGAQSATLIIRALVTGDVKLFDWGKVLLKELLVGVCLGLVLGLAGAALGVFYSSPMIGVVIGLTMILIVIVSNLIGMILPFGLTILKLDPAVASGPLITTIVDATGLLIYFSIASWILKL